jgi:ribosome biogenesis GTPase / thiamine phosphate phosphatase
VIHKKSLGWYQVHTGDSVIICSLSSKLRKELIYPTADLSSLPHRVQEVKEIKYVDPLAIGDQVVYLEAHDGAGVIVQVLPRRNVLSRRAAVSKSPSQGYQQAIVANVDQVVAVFAAARPAPKWNLLDRYLVSAEASQLPSLICITKLDLVLGEDGSIDGDLMAMLREYRAIGYPAVLTSSVTKAGLRELRQMLEGKISVLVGKSGVGKTSLLNTLQPELGLRVAEVGRESGKGKHATSYLEMFPFSFGGAIVDTPGMREFGLWDLDAHELIHCFPEMRSLAGKCRFGLDCQHNEEPGCALRRAVCAGQVDPRRYQSYLRLKAEM